MLFTKFFEKGLLEKYHNSPNFIPYKQFVSSSLLEDLSAFDRHIICFSKGNIENEEEGDLRNLLDRITRIIGMHASLARDSDSVNRKIHHEQKHILSIIIEIVENIKKHGLVDEEHPSFISWKIENDLLYFRTSNVFFFKGGRISEKDKLSEELNESNNSKYQEDRDHRKQELIWWHSLNENNGWRVGLYEIAKNIKKYRGLKEHSHPIIEYKIYTHTDTDNPLHKIDLLFHIPLKDNRNPEEIKKAHANTHIIHQTTTHQIPRSASSEASHTLPQDSGEALCEILTQPHDLRQAQ